MNYLKSKAKIISFKISIFFFFISILWILFSDTILYLINITKENITFFQSIKGTLYISFTSLLIFTIIYYLVYLSNKSRYIHPLTHSPNLFFLTEIVLKENVKNIKKNLGKPDFSLVKIYFLNIKEIELILKAEQQIKIWNEIFQSIHKILNSFHLPHQIFHSIDNLSLYVLIGNIQNQNLFESILNQIQNEIYHITEEKFVFPILAKISYSISEQFNKNFYIEVNYAMNLLLSYSYQKMNLNRYQPEIKEEVEKKIYIVQHIQEAIQNNEFFLVFQPIVNTIEKKIIGAETLIRWNHEGKFIPPSDFIPIAEQMKFIKRIDFCVLNELVKSTFEFYKENIHIPFTFNLAPEEIYDKDIIYFILKNLPDNFEYHIEITERTLAEDISIIKEHISELKKNKNIKIAIDDFGTGYSSLSQLPKYPVDIIKIDRNFIKNYKELDYQRIIKNILHICEDFNFDVIAEGVETREQEQFLVHLKCIKIQGYLYSPPIEKEKFIKFYQIWNQNHI